jgi:alpha-methylacyl-CoA racemase
VLSFPEVATHPHIAGRGSVVTIDGVIQAAPAPRFSRSESLMPSPPPVGATDLGAVIGDWEKATDRPGALP